MSTILRGSLPNSIPDDSSATLWRCHQDISALDITSIASAIEDPDQLASSHFFKREKRRLIFRTSISRGDVAVKALPLNHFKARLRYRRYAYAEAIHLLEAAQRGLPVPEVLAYGEKRKWGLVSWNAVVMTFLPHEPMRDRLLAGASPEEIQHLLDRAGQLLIKLYHCGCNHIDFGPHAVMLHPEDPDQDHTLDLQYCRFDSGELRPETLAAVAGYFAWSVSTNRDWISAGIMQEWFQQHLALLSLESQLADLLPIYDHARAERASIGQRLSQ